MGTGRQELTKSLKHTKQDASNILDQLFLSTHVRKPRTGTAAEAGGGVGGGGGSSERNKNTRRIKIIHWH